MAPFPPIFAYVIFGILDFIAFILYITGIFAIAGLFFSRVRLVLASGLFKTCLVEEGQPWENHLEVKVHAHTSRKGWAQTARRRGIKVGA